ncbi:MAG: hypothetical protein J7J98_08665 [candidate division Zixibacteria bacterium]|nr:hypothetical protein [candidate division Zixibacteria bacterium]
MKPAKVWLAGLFQPNHIAKAVLFGVSPLISINQGSIVPAKSKQNKIVES